MFLYLVWFHRINHAVNIAVSGEIIQMKKSCNLNLLFAEKGEVDEKATQTSSPS